MRIITGKYKGLKLAKFEGYDIRPTADRIKESLFNILGEDIRGARVLDLFCGSGNLGIESLSRGALFVHFNDKSRDSIAVLKKNLAKIRDNNYKISISDYSLCLSQAGKFDIIFIDPPYSSDFGLDALKIIGDKKLLAEGGLAIFESEKSFSSDVPLTLFDERKYGRTYLSFFKDGEL